MSKEKHTKFESGVDTNEMGGKQSKLEVRFDLIDADAIATIANVLYEGGKKYGKDNWRLIAVEDHINHAINHLFKATNLLDSSNPEDSLEDLSHGATRAIFALAKFLRPDYFGVAANALGSNDLLVNKKAKLETIKEVSREELLNSQKFKAVGDFHEGLAWVRDCEDREFHIKSDGTPAYPQRFKWIGDFREGFALAQDFKGNEFKINTKGERVN